MQYSVHTIELRKKLYNLLDTFDARNRLYEKASGHYKCYRDPEVPGDHISEIFKGKGIRVRLRETQYNGYMFFSVSLNDLLGLGDKVELIDPQNLQAALERADEMLIGEFGEAYSIERLDLTRVDQCINLDIGSSEYVSEYIKLLNCSQMKKGYKIATSDSPEFEFENGCTFWNKNEWLALSFYDKKKEREQKKCEADVADGILRVELRLLNKKVVNLHSAPYYSNARKIECFVNSSKNDILDIARLLLLDADYYTIRKACDIVKKSVKKPKRQERMIELLRLARKYSSVRKAKELLMKRHPKLRHDYYDLMMEDFQRIGVNVVTLPKGSKFKHLPSLFRYLE